MLDYNYIVVPFPSGFCECMSSCGRCARIPHNPQPPPKPNNVRKLLQMADGIEKDMAVEEGGDVKLDIAFGNDKEVDIANFVDGEPSNGLARPTKKS